MKIAYVCNEYPPRLHGGVGTFVHTIARGMKDAGHSVTVVGFGEEPEVRDDAGVRVVTLRASTISKISWIVDRWRLHQWLAGEVLAGRIEVIEIPDYGGMLPLPFHAGCKRGSEGSPVVVRLHLSETIIANAEEMMPEGHASNSVQGLTVSRIRLLDRITRIHQTGSRYVLAKCERATLKHHPNWIGVSKYILGLTKQTFGLTPSRSEVIYYPVVAPPADSRCDIPLPQDFVLYAGTVSARKGAYILAEAARHFLPPHPELHLVYVGRLVTEGGKRADTRILEIVGNGLAKRIRFLGYVDRATAIVCMRRAKAFAFPTTLESFCLVAAEAMLAGVPVVVPDAGPFPEFVTQEKTGLLVPAGDACAFAQAVLRLLESPSLRRHLAGNAQSLVKSRFTLEACITGSERFYEETLEAGRARASC